MRVANLKSLRDGDGCAMGEDCVSRGTCALCCEKMDRLASCGGEVGGEYELARIGLEERGEETDGRYLVCCRGVVEEEDVTGGASKVKIGVGIMANMVMACSRCDVQPVF